MGIYKFTLESTIKGNEDIEAPLGWNELNFVLSRDTETEGVFNSFSSELTFVKKGYLYINDIIQNYGLQKDVFLRIEKIDNANLTYSLAQLAKLDFSSYSYDNSQGKGIKISLISDGFTEKLLTRKDNDIKLNAKKDIDGNALVDITSQYKDVKVLGQTVVIGGEGRGGNEELNYDASPDPSSSDRYDFVLPITFEGNQSNNINSVASVGFLNFISVSVPKLQSSDSCMYFAENTPSTITVDINYNIYYYVANSQTDPPNFDWAYLARFKKQSDGTMKYINKISSYYKIGLGENYYNITDTQTIELQENEGVALIHYGSSVLGSNPTSTKYRVLDTTRIEITAKELALETTSKHLLMYEANKRMCEIITGTGNFKSSVFGRTDSDPVYTEDGEYSLVGLANGYLYRGYSIPESQLSINAANFMRDLKNIANIRYGVELIEDVPYLVAEDRSYFYNDDVVHIVTDMERKSFSKEPYSDIFYSKIIAGKDKFDFEESSALSTQHVKQNFTTIVKNFDSELNLEHELNTDPYLAEFARRRPKSSDTDLDTPYDNQNIILDLARDGNDLAQRNKEGFDTVQVSKPIDTFGNLRFTPARIVDRWGDFIKQCVRYDTDKDIIYQRNDVLTDLKTEKSGESKTISECTDIDPDLLDNSLFTGQLVTFSAPLPYSVFVKLNKNRFGRIQYTNPITKETEQGWIMEVSINPVDSRTNYKLIQCSGNINVVEYYGLGTNNGEAISTNNGEIIQLNG